FQYLSAFVSKEPAVVYSVRVSPALADARRINGIATIVITNLVVIIPLVLALRRWRPPFGTVAVLFGVSALMVNAMHEFSEWPVIVAALAAGAGTDLLIERLHVAPSRAGLQRLAVCAASLQLWLGTIVLATLCTFALSYVVTFPLPLTA